MDHMKEVHKKSRDLKCSKCDKSYKQSQTILRHIRNFHEGRCLLVILCCHTKDMLEISAHEGIRIDSNMCGWKQVHIIKTSKHPKHEHEHEVQAFPLWHTPYHMSHICGSGLFFKTMDWVCVAQERAFTIFTFEFLFLFMNCIRMI